MTSVMAEPLGLKWSDRVTVETADGDLVDTAPFVKIGPVALSRFALMQRLTLHETLFLQGPTGPRTLYAFRAWQGGAGQGEQLMLVTSRPDGVDVIGPVDPAFETLKILPPLEDTGPVFEFYGEDTKTPLARLEYISGQLLNIE